VLFDTQASPRVESLFVWNQTGADGVSRVYGTRLDDYGNPMPAVLISASSASASRPGVAASIGQPTGSVDDFLLTWDDGLTLWGVRVSLSLMPPRLPPVSGTPFVVAQHTMSPSAACTTGTSAVRCAIAWRDRQSERILATVFGMMPDASAPLFAFPVEPGASLPAIRPSLNGASDQFGIFRQYFPTIGGIVTPRVRYAIINDNGLGIVPQDSSDFPGPGSCGSGANAPQIGPAATVSSPNITAWTEPSATPGAPPTLVLCPSY
jgi:hypothetical protein